ncbi:MAG TPA: M3 family oligoendopeptidase [Opitutaceae bacterium]
MSNPVNVARTWDLSSYFPRFDGPEFSAFKTALRQDVARHLKHAALLAPLSEQTLDAWRDEIVAGEDLAARVGHLSSYIGCLSAADASSEAYRAEEAALATVSAELEKLRGELLRALHHAPEALLTKLEQAPGMEGTGYFLRRLRQEAGLRMSTAEETLAADLNIDGLHAWGRLYDTLTGKMTFEMAWPDGRRETLPMSQRRSLMANQDRAVRKAAFDGGNVVWAANEDALAAALNGIAGTRHTLNRRRGIGHFLDSSLFDAAVSRRTIDAMFAAIHAQAALPRRILHLMGRLQGTKGIAWYDQEAPMQLPPQPPVNWEQACAMVDRAFSEHYPAIGDYFEDLLIKRWAESEKRPNKRPGAFCTGSELIREQRVYMTYNDTMNDVVTLAHEVGHAFHSHVLRTTRPLATNYPMTLAETASNFGEMLLIHGLLREPGLTPGQRAFLLDCEVGRAPSYLLNITARYEFERAFYEERAAGEVPVSRLHALMTAAQHKVFGDALEPGGEDPYFWASKLHFFISGLSFYNYPYTFGYLLSHALFAQFRREGPDFLPKYEAFLRRTGSATCEDAVREALGRDITQPEFWAEAIHAIEHPLKELEALLPSLVGTK